LCPGDSPDPRRDRQRSAERTDDVVRCGDRHVVAGQRGCDAILVAGREQTADDRDAERSADLEGHRVGGRADA
jgi:hypothetical protein